MEDNIKKMSDYIRDLKVGLECMTKEIRRDKKIARDGVKKI